MDGLKTSRVFALPGVPLDPFTSADPEREVALKGPGLHARWLSHWVPGTGNVYMLFNLN